MKKQLLLFAMVLLPLVASAHDIEVENADGVTIYYKYINEGTELAVTYRGYFYEAFSDEYQGNVVIPEEVTYMNRTRKVTSIGSEAFRDCSGLTSVTIPNSVTSIGDNAFSFCYNLTSVTIPNSVTSIGIFVFCQCQKLTSVTISNSLTSIGDYVFSYCSSLTSVTIPNSVTNIGHYAFIDCSSLTSVTIPNSVTSIGKRAFDGVDIPIVVSLIENPFTIYRNTANDRTFSNNTFLNATLYVPVGTIEKYKATEGWKDFVFIEEGSGPGGGGGTPGSQKCEKPTISYKNGKLSFNCETDGATCQYTITDDDIKSGNGYEVQLGVTYKISVYATKAGFEDSDKATATLCWIDVDPRTEGITNIAQIRANAIMIQSGDGVLNVSGVDDGQIVSVYSVSGQIMGTSKASNNQATIATNLKQGEIAIVKIGDKSVKVVIQ